MMKAGSRSQQRRLNRSPKVAVSDRELKEILDAELKNNPEFFVPSDSVAIIEKSQEFLSISSARLIEPIKKWL